MGKNLKIFNLSAIHALKNYKALIGLIIFQLICLVIFSNLWKVIAAKMGIFHFNPSELLWYIALNECVIIAIPHPEKEIEHDLRSGKLAYSLPRPMSYLCAAFYESLGIFCVNFLVLAAAAFAFTWMQVGAIPVPLWGVPSLIFTGVIAGIVGILFQMLLGLGSFWLHEIEPLTWLWEKLLFALGGLMFPLSVYPLMWQAIAKYTPFPYIMGARSALVIDYSLSNILFVITALILWTVIGMALLFLLYRRGLKILNIEGG